ncbi:MULTISPECIES: copper chaperone PCu(A)C [Halomonadaceae]|uniref:Copper chaperone PCu(A)C n=1 Tax=Vreelandella piezotolerans TaxID=2609667 RepID=A0ABQ6X699_9GAMM|nr:MULTISPECIES: copper chaperone PCu(A)C [Halomonas]KAE8437549.1 copper chaperone PCu(A)C [Halomonas piezotolerans]MCG7590673.1 copper chaperone PCu(A)C [Halomonas sp. McD50-5]MCG7616785.1 copper chaperone PCu(A)C [Halomonas sp. McD50-4]QJA25573.1 copper chaperone PCu(A)C [Halomonas piezotolerans]TNH18753.1 copper chaperone PCu(A)C [Halomonas sp. BL6]
MSMRATLLTALLMMSTPLLAAHHGGDSSEAMAGHSAIEAEQPWTRATPPGAGAGGGFVTLTNHGDGDDMLIGATSPVTERVEIHIMEMDGDVMRMAPLPGGIELPAGGSVTLAPGGLHLMLMELDSPIVEGEPVPVTLEFQHAEPMEIELRVLPVGESPEGHHHESGHSHGHNHAAH